MKLDMGENQWDAIISIWAHLPSDMRKSLHARCVSALKPGGHFILEAYHPRQLEYKTGGPQDMNKFMTLDLLNIELSGLDFLLSREMDREINEGEGHGGMSAVVQVLAKKPE